MECVQCMAYNNSLVHYTFLLQHLCGGEVDMAQAAHTCSHTHYYYLPWKALICWQQFLVTDALYRDPSMASWLLSTANENLNK